MLRKCRKCGENKIESSEFFYKRSTGKLDTICKVCTKERTLKWARKKGISPRKTVTEEHKKAVKSKINKKYYKSKGKDNAKRWRKDNPDKVKEHSKRYRESNKHKVAIRSRDRKLRTSQSILAKEFSNDIGKIYEKCSYMSDKYKCNFQVDHIIPLKNDNVCGLHVPWNLQIIFKTLNCKKSNKFDGTYDNNGWCSNG